MTIKKQFLMVIILLSTIPFILVPWTGYFYIAHIMEEQLLLQSEQNVEQITKDVEQVLDDLIGTSNALTLDEDLITALGKKESTEHYLSTMRKVNKKLSNVNAAYLYTYNADISIYTSENELYTTTAFNADDGVKDYRQEWIKEAALAKGRFIWKCFLPGERSKYQKETSIGMARAILDINGKAIGVLAIELFADRHINRILCTRNEFQNTERYLTDYEGHIIVPYKHNSKGESVYSPKWFKRYIEGKKSEFVEVIKESTQKEVVSMTNISKTNWRLIQIIPYKDLLSKLSYYRNFTISINLFFLMAIIILDILSIDRLTQSITNLRDAMKHVRKGEFITIHVPKTNQEVAELSRDFNRMSVQLNNLFEENKRISEEKERTKLEALQKQIQPHFLFNTLNGIKWLCIMEKAPTAEKMLVSLGYLLEYSLSKNREIITLKEEITCLKHYISLQKMRYGENFDVSFFIEDDLENLQVPILFLQPLIENAILHGLQDLDYIGQIEVRAYKSEDKIYIKVEDNGCGMSEETMNELLKGSGIGIKNIEERIKIYYGQSSKLMISSREKGGTIVTICLPLEGGKYCEKYNS